MADTATFSGAMQPVARINPGFRKVAKRRGDRRPGSLRSTAPAGVARSAAQRRVGELAYQRTGQHRTK